MFSCEFCDIFKNTFFTGHLWATASEPFSLVIFSLESRLFFLQLFSVLVARSSLLYEKPVLKILTNFLLHYFMENLPTIIFAAGICLFKFNNEDTRTMCEICSKLIIKTLERLYWRHFGVLNFENISHTVLVFPPLTSCKKRPVTSNDFRLTFLSLLSLLQSIYRDFYGMSVIFQLFLCIYFDHLTKRKKELEGFLLIGSYLLLLWNTTSALQRYIWNPDKHLSWSFLPK